MAGYPLQPTGYAKDVSLAGKHDFILFCVAEDPGLNE